MIVYRITLEKFADNFHASGNPARWNSKDVKIIYTAESRALACLENVVHRVSRGLHQNYRTLLIEIPDDIKYDVIKGENLIENWRLFENMTHTQSLGDEWIKNKTSALLRVPSAIIPEEFNYLLNPQHEDFKRIQLLSVEPFAFDGRLQ